MRYYCNMPIVKVGCKMLKKTGNPIFNIFITFPIWKSIIDVPICIGIKFTLMVLIQFTVICFPQSAVLNNLILAGKR